MKKSSETAIILLLVGTAIITGTGAFALGIGPYIDAFGGQSYRKVKTGAWEDTGGTATNYGFRAGLLFDTCVACDEVFSYRLKLGGGLSKSDLAAKTSYSSFHMSHTFALAAVKNDLVKFWIGPQIGFSYYRGSNDRFYAGAEHAGAAYLLVNQPVTLNDLWNFGVFKERSAVNLYGATGGLAFGVNLNLGDYVSLALEAGVVYGYIMGRQKREVYGAAVPVIPYDKFRETITDNGLEGYGSAAFMIRFVDTYQ